MHSSRRCPPPATALRPTLLLLLLAVVLPSWLAACGPAAKGSSTPASGAAAATFDAARAWSQLERIVAFGPRPSGSPANDGLKGYLEEQLRAAGLQPVRQGFRAKTPHDETAFANIYADIGGRPGKDGKPAPLVILGSHFDTKRMPFPFVGANDGGSSTAVLLELARVLAPGAGQRDVAYRVVFLDGEEAVRPEWIGDDNCYGSRHHAAELVARGEKARVRAFVLLDLVGDKDLKLQTETYSDPQLLKLFFDAAKAAGLGKHVDGTRLEVRDDHLSFMNVGIKSVNLIDFNYGESNKHWHSPSDTLEQCSQQSLDAIGRIVLAGLPALEAWALKQPGG
jgi:hypothetical protein